MVVSQWVKDIVEEVFGKSNLEIGKILKHPDGRTVKIMSGQYWGQYGLSNHWSWREIFSNGEMGPEENGYGW